MQYLKYLLYKLMTPVRLIKRKRAIKARAKSSREKDPFIYK